jgi:hypothetical protein
MSLSSEFVDATSVGELAPALLAAGRTLSGSPRSERSRQTPATRGARLKDGRILGPRVG